jgi:hypothetical protein
MVLLLRILRTKLGLMLLRFLWRRRGGVIGLLRSSFRRWGSRGSSAKRAWVPGHRR